MHQFEIFKPHQQTINYGVTPREWGSFQERQPEFEPSMQRLMKETGLARPVTAYQQHEAKVLNLKKRPLRKPSCDGLITQVAGLPVMVKVADCQGVLMFDPKTRAVGALHSGWKGSILNIIGKGIERMGKVFGSKPSDLLVAVSPSLGPCCARFTEPREELPNSFGPYIQGYFVDFWSLSVDQCKAAGVPESNVEVARICTVCGSDLYFSYRNGDNGRTGVFIALN